MQRPQHAIHMPQGAMVPMQVAQPVTQQVFTQIAAPVQPVVYQQQQQRPMPAPTVMTKQLRKVMTRRSADSLRILHNGESMDPGCCSDKMMHDSTYTWVMENRIEWNRPIKICCGGRQDIVSVVYYDDFDSARDSTPCCADCRGIGEVVSLKTTCCCCIPLTVHSIGHLKDSATVITHINKAKKELRSLTGDWDA